MTELIKYEAARRALAEAVAVDEVKQIHDRADALRHAARIAGDKQLEIQAAQIRFRAERRFGELMAAQHAAGKVARGGRPRAEKTPDNSLGVSDPADALPEITLRDIGVDYRFSSRAQKLAELPEDKFETLVERHADEMRSGAGRVTMDLLKIGAEEDGRERRRQLARELSDATAELPSGRRFPVIYADPPWHRKQGVTGRSYENHYSTMSWADICALPIKDAVLPDAWLFLWIPRAHMFALHAIEVEAQTRNDEIITVLVDMPLAYAVAKSWGFEAYSTAFIWTKTDDEHPADHGGGVVVFDQDEVLLLFKRGRGLPKPATDEKFGSNHRERSKPLGHSRKPEFYRDMIATMSGGVPVLELFARVDAEHPLPEGWEAFGNQAGGGDVSTAPADSESISADTTSEIADSTTADADIIPVLDDSHANADDEASAGQACEADAESVSRLAAGRTADAAADDVPATSPAAKDSVDEFTALRAISSYAYQGRQAIVAAVGEEYIKRGYAYLVGGATDYQLTEAGWARLNELKAAQEIETASNNVSREIGDIIAEQRIACDALDVIDIGGAVTGDLSDKLLAEELISGKGKLKLTKLGRERREQWRLEVERYDRLMALPADIDVLVTMYHAALSRLQMHVLASDDSGIDDEYDMLALLQERANGDTQFGMATDESPAERLRSATAAPIGQEPYWCQRGMFQVVVDGVSCIVTHNEHGDFALHAVDPSKPFITETGYRSCCGTESYAIGCSVAQHAEKLIRNYLASEDDHKSGKRKKRKAALPLPEHVYRLPLPDEGYRPRRVEVAEAQKALAEPDLFAPPAVAQPRNADVVQTRMPLDDEEFELRDALAQLAHGDEAFEPPKQLVRDLIGRGWLDFNIDANPQLQVTAEGHAWLASFVDPVPSTTMESAQL